MVNTADKVMADNNAESDFAIIFGPLTKKNTCEPSSKVRRLLD